MGLEPNPFDSVAVYGSPRKGADQIVPDIATRTIGTHTYYWTIAEFVEQELLPFLFADAEDERQQYTMVIHNVAARLKQDGQRIGDDGIWSIDGQPAPHVRRARQPHLRPGRGRRAPASTGRAAPPAPARSTRSSAGCARRSVRSAT